MGGRGKKLSKKMLTAIISFAVFTAFFCAVVITNIFIPIKYLTTYLTVRAERKDGVLSVTYVDVGYGDCIIIQLPDGKNMLIDCGDGGYANMLTAMRSLNARGIDTIDYLVCSSVRAEHCGGLSEILQYKKVQYAYTPYCKNEYITDEYHNFCAYLKSKKISSEIAQSGVGVVNEEYGYYFVFISPADYSSAASEYTKLNSTNSAENVLSASAMLWLEYQGTSFLFTSDASEATLKTITESYQMCNDPLVGQEYCTIGTNSVKLETCNIVTVPGHGAEACTYAPFYELLSPTSAVVSVGKNYSGCPSAIALGNICNYVTPYFTSDKGNIQIDVNEYGYKIHY